MKNLLYSAGDASGFQYEGRNNSASEKAEANKAVKKVRRKDEDLIIEENTIYEIDRECYERLKKQKK